MKLNEFHVRNRHAGTPGHRNAIAGRDIGIRCVEINFAAAAGCQDDAVRANRFYFPGSFVEHVSAEATIFRGGANLRRRNEIDRHVVLQKIDM